MRNGTSQSPFRPARGDNLLCRGRPADPWDDKGYQIRSQGARNPVATGDNAQRCLRGGAWRSAAADLRAAFRRRISANDRLGGIGFRVAAARASRGRL